MRILKSFQKKDPAAETVSRTFDRMITSIYHPWRFDRLEMHVCYETKAETRGRSCILSIDYNDMFVQQRDARGVAVLIARLLFKIITRETHGELPEVIENIIANRMMIRRGYGDDLVYYYYQKNLFLPQPETPLQQLEQEVAWLSFYPEDRYNAEFLRRKRGGMKSAEGLIERLRGDLDGGENLNAVLRIYHSIARQSRTVI